MLSLHRATWPRLYVDCLKEAGREGYTRPSREGDTVELGPALLSCPHPSFVELSGRAGSSKFAELEQLCYLAGQPPDPLIQVAPRYERFREADGTWHGAYGPRLEFTLGEAVRELGRHQFTRRAVAMIWREDDIVQLDRRDVPCTISLTYWLGPAGEVRSMAHMRSCDLWFGLYYDLPAFGFLQRAVAKALGRPCGRTFLSATSLHLYNKDLDRAKYVKPRLLPATVPVFPVLPEPEGTMPYTRFLWLQNWASYRLEVEVGLLTGVEVAHAPR